MKKEWKVYIRGVEGHGSEVIATLANLGASTDLSGGLGNNPDRIYYIKHNGHISSTGIDTETGKIIVDHYQEIKLHKPKPKPWKDGDILINNDGTRYKIFSEYDTNISTNFFAYMSISVNGIIAEYDDSVWVCEIKDYHLATPQEIEHFHDILHKKHKEWNAKKKQLTYWKWKPNDNEGYYFIFSDGSVHLCAWLDDEMDTSRFIIGNCFKTKEEAEIMAEKFKKLLKDNL